MSSLDRIRPNRRSLLILPLALAACGFTPAYGPSGPAKHLQGAIHAIDPTDKNGFDLVERIEQNFGPHIEQKCADLCASFGMVSSCIERAVSGSKLKLN